jgi:2-keto-4-pentenoate hydratase/2-oxohepta-3-ene-1,7-dioic acid hydratase in catechol pathway
MRLANIANRLTLVTANGEIIDISKETGGSFSPRIQECYERWDELLEVAATLQGTTGKPLSQVQPSEFGNPVPLPRQIFAIGLNYADHAAEASLAVPEDLTVFTKFATSLAGPYGIITLPPGTVDWEVELVAIIGRGGQHIPAERAWGHVAGVSVGQDLSERTMQASGPAPQYSLAKSFPGFGPIGPLLAPPMNSTIPTPSNWAVPSTANRSRTAIPRTWSSQFPRSSRACRGSRHCFPATSSSPVPRPE